MQHVAYTSLFGAAPDAAFPLAITGRQEAYRSRPVYGAEKWQVDAWVSTYTAIKAGDLRYFRLVPACALR